MSELIVPDRCILCPSIAPLWERSIELREVYYEQMQAGLRVMHAGVPSSATLASDALNSISRFTIAANLNRTDNEQQALQTEVNQLTEGCPGNKPGIVRLVVLGEKAIEGCARPCTEVTGRKP